MLSAQLHFRRSETIFPYNEGQYHWNFVPLCNPEQVNDFIFKLFPHTTSWIWGNKSMMYDLIEQAVGTVPGTGGR